jgi:hypothetical protein
MKKLFSVIVFLAASFGLSQAQVTPVAQPSRVGGTFYAAQYAQWDRITVAQGNSTTGSATITLQWGSAVLPDGREISPFAVTAPIIVGTGATRETVTPTAVSSCYKGRQSVNYQICQITASFSNTHGAGEQVFSGSFGLQEAINDAYQVGAVGGSASSGGEVVVDSQWTGLGGTNSTIAAAIPYQGVVLADFRSAQQAWTPRPSTTSFIATPTTLTATTVGFGLNGANTTGGTYTGASTYHVCVAYVDIAGNEGACSADFSGLTAGTGTTNQIGFSAPAASTGAVGYTVYISLAGGSYALAYQVPLTSSVCTLTTIETITPACAVTNATYGQTGSAAIVSALTVNTSPLALQLGGTNNQLGTGNSGAHTTYAYAPSGFTGGYVLGANVAYTATAGGAASTNPVVMATVPVPAGFMNFVGRTIRVCAKMKQTIANSPTIENWQVYWDGAGSDSAGSPVQIANINGTATFTNVAYNGSFCESFTTTVSGSGVTAGSIIGGANVASMGIASAPTNLVTMLDTLNSATASLNLAGGGGFTSRLHIVTNHTTGADGASQVLSLTVEVL